MPAFATDGGVCRQENLPMFVGESLPGWPVYSGTVGTVQVQRDGTACN